MMSIEATQAVDEIMRQWPVTIRVFLDYQMRCVGCPIACFHTVDDACREHGTDRERFLADLRAAITERTACAVLTEPEVVMAHWPATR